VGLAAAVTVGLIVGCGSQGPTAGGEIAGSGSGGAAGTSVMIGSAGGTAGSDSGKSAGTVGAAGAAGTSASGEVGGRPGGTAGAAGITGSTPTTDAGTSVDGGSAPTFSQVYKSVLTAYCGGGACHNPGSQHGISFASQSSSYSAVRNRVIPGDGEGSSFYYTVYSGTMPPGGPKLSATNLAMIRAWIDAGAVDS